jgi:hypothetical protein
MFHRRLLVAWIHLFHLLVSKAGTVLAASNFRNGFLDRKVALANGYEYYTFDIMEHLKWEECCINSNSVCSCEILGILKHIFESLTLLDQSDVITMLVNESDSLEYLGLLEHVIPRKMILELQQHFFLQSVASIKDTELQNRLSPFVVVIEAFQAAKLVQENKSDLVFEKALYSIENSLWNQNSKSSHSFI